MQLGPIDSQHWSFAGARLRRGLVGKAFYKTNCDDVKRLLTTAPVFRRYSRELLGAYPEVSDVRIYAPIFEES